MAKGKGSIKGWITKNGIHIPIYGEYTVRGGVEPKTKGVKWGKGKKKPDKYTNPRTGKRDHVQGKTQADLNKALKEQGLELDGAYQRAENEEKVYMYDKEGNVYSGTFNKYSDGGKEIVNIEKDTLNGESNVRNLDPDRDEHIKNGESKGAKREEAIKKQVNERFKTAKELKAEGKWDTSEKDKYADRDFSSDLANAHKAGYSEQKEDKYANRDWNKDVEDSKRYGYSEQSEEGKKPVTKDEEYKSKLAEANKAFDVGDYKEYNRRAKELKQMQASGDVSDDTITGKTQAQRERDDAKFQARQRANEANSLVNEGMDKDQARKAVSGQESSTPDYIKSSNMDGQELKIPRKTYEDRLATLKKTKEEMLKKPGQNPNTLNKYDQMIKQTEESLRTGIDAEYSPKSIKESSNTAYDYNGQTITHHPNGVKPAFHGNEEYNYEVHPAKGEKGANQYFKTEQEAQDYINGRNTKVQASSTSNLGSMSDKELVDAYRNSTDKDERYKIAGRLNVRGYSLQPDRESWKKTGSLGDESKIGQRTRDYQASLVQSGGKKPASAEVSRIIHGDEQESSTQTFSPESSAKAINEMARRRFNGGGKKDDWKIAHEAFEAAPAGTTVIETGNRGVKFQYTKGEDGTWHSSAGEEYNSDSKTLAMSWVGDSGPSVQFTTSDKALSNEDIKASHTAAVNGRLNQALGLDKNERAIGNRAVPKVASASETPQSVRAMRKQSVQDSLSAGMNKRSQIRASISDSNKAKSGDYSSMTVSGLKAAMAGARPGDKTKIRAELRKRGYTYIGGRWVKGTK